MNKPNPLVSIIIPTFNRSSLLKLAMASVFTQSYSPIELIIVDDGSTDNTKSAIQDLISQQQTVQYFWKENRGCASARNYGLRKSKGEYILFLDSDNKLDNKAVENLVKRIVETDSEFVYSPSIEVFSGKNEFVNYPVAAGTPETLAVDHFCNTNIRNGSYLFSRSVVEYVGLLDEKLRFNEDSDFVQRLAFHCNAAYLDTPTVRVLNHPQSKSRNRVEVIKALIKSSETNLQRYPDFAMRLGSKAENRIKQLKTDLIKELITQKKYEDALEVRRELKKPLSWYLVFSLFFRTNLLIKFVNWVQKALRKLLTIIGNKDR